MNNSSAQEVIEGCSSELEKIHFIIQGIGVTSHPVPYLTKYAIIKACGTIEYCFKTILSDTCTSSQSQQVKNFVDNTFRNSSMNPNRDNISKVLKQFDEEWNTRFKAELNALDHKDRILDSLKSLNEARNTFAHGGNPSASFESVRNYFTDALKIIEIIDGIVNGTVQIEPITDDIAHASTEQSESEVEN